ncbi:glycosyltransferase family A protein [Streptomyces sp. NBC_00059]|uniref:glycosyltransferase family A protein n=1 Tax=Streptomyces sp. NBC_00059 TaxID=2975635 RepID=UPI00224FF8F8|nr:glycosyltransferase family A protein [Streptomyces sp. NBC_00059]MCX5416149.1 glycosyltransferase family 2 protein [Streptomyces sp. NBC_00059]
MAFFTLACAFHDTERLLEKTLPLAIRSITRPTRHDFEVILVADRATDDAVARLLPRLEEFGVDELRFRRTDRNSFAGLPSNNFHGNNFTVTNPYLIVFTDDSFIWKTDENFDVLDATARLFEQNPEVTLLSKVDDHEEWDSPLIDVGPEIEPGVRSVNRVVDQFMAYDTRRFEPVARRFGAWDRDVFTGKMGFEYHWEALASHVGRTGGRSIAWPGQWPLRVRHCDLRFNAGSMHGTQDEDIKLTCFERLLESEGLHKK